MDDGPTIQRSLDLTDVSVPAAQLNVPLPWPIDERLNRLVGLIAMDKLGPTTKRELTAALIQTAEPTALQLWERVLRYRRATVGDAAFWVPEAVDPIVFDARQRGRPRGKSRT